MRLSVLAIAVSLVVIDRPVADAGRRGGGLKLASKGSFSMSSGDRAGAGEELGDVPDVVPLPSPKREEAYGDCRVQYDKCLAAPTTRHSYEVLLEVTPDEDTRHGVHQLDADGLPFVQSYRATVSHNAAPTVSPTAGPTRSPTAAPSAFAPSAFSTQTKTLSLTTTPSPSPAEAPTAMRRMSVANANSTAANPGTMSQTVVETSEQTSDQSHARSNTESPAQRHESLVAPSNTSNVSVAASVSIGVLQATEKLNATKEWAKMLTTELDSVKQTEREARMEEEEATVNATVAEESLGTANRTLTIAETAIKQAEAASPEVNAAKAKVQAAVQGVTTKTSADSTEVDKAEADAAAKKSKALGILAKTARVLNSTKAKAAVADKKHIPGPDQAVKQAEANMKAAEDNLTKQQQAVETASEEEDTANTSGYLAVEEEASKQASQAVAKEKEAEGEVSRAKKELVNAKAGATSARMNSELPPGDKAIAKTGHMNETDAAAKAAAAARVNVAQKNMVEAKKKVAQANAKMEQATAKRKAATKSTPAIAGIVAAASKSGSGSAVCQDKSDKEVKALSKGMVQGCTMAKAFCQHPEHGKKIQLMCPKTCGFCSSKEMSKAEQELAVAKTIVARKAVPGAVTQIQRAKATVQAAANKVEEDKATISKATVKAEMAQAVQEETEQKLENAQTAVRKAEEVLRDAKGRAKAVHPASQNQAVDNSVEAAKQTETQSESMIAASKPEKSTIGTVAAVLTRQDGTTGGDCVDSIPYSSFPNEPFMTNESPAKSCKDIEEAGWCGEGKVLKPEKVNDQSIWGKAGLEHTMFSPADMCCACGGGDENVPDGYYSITGGVMHIMERNPAFNQSAAMLLEMFVKSEWQGSNDLTTAVSGVQRGSRSGEGKFAVFSMTGGSGAARGQSRPEDLEFNKCEQKSGIQFHICKTCNCNELMLVSQFSEQTRGTMCRVWSITVSAAYQAMFVTLRGIVSKMNPHLRQCYGVEPRVQSTDKKKNALEQLAKNRVSLCAEDYHSRKLEAQKCRDRERGSIRASSKEEVAKKLEELCSIDHFHGKMTDCPKPSKQIGKQSTPDAAATTLIATKTDVPAPAATPIAAKEAVTGNQLMAMSADEKLAALKKMDANTRQKLLMGMKDGDRSKLMGSFNMMHKMQLYMALSAEEKAALATNGIGPRL